MQQRLSTRPLKIAIFGALLCAIIWLTTLYTEHKFDTTLAKPLEYIGDTFLTAGFPAQAELFYAQIKFQPSKTAEPFAVCAKAAYAALLAQHKAEAVAYGNRCVQMFPYQARRESLESLSKLAFVSDHILLLSAREELNLTRAFESYDKQRKYAYFLGMLICPHITKFADNVEADRFYNERFCVFLASLFYSEINQDREGLKFILSWARVHNNEFGRFNNTFSALTAGLESKSLNPGSQLYVTQFIIDAVVQTQMEPEVKKTFMRDIVWLAQFSQRDRKETGLKFSPASWIAFKNEGSIEEKYFANLLFALAALDNQEAGDFCSYARAALNKAPARKASEGGVLSPGEFLLSAMTGLNNSPDLIQLLSELETFGISNNSSSLVFDAKLRRLEELVVEQNYDQASETWQELSELLSDKFLSNAEIEEMRKISDMCTKQNLEELSNKITDGIRRGKTGHGCRLTPSRHRNAQKDQLSDPKTAVRNKRKQ